MKQDFQLARLVGVTATICLIAIICGCVRIERLPTSTRQVSQLKTSQVLVNINTASGAELESLPGIGRVMAERIVAHREKYGAFRRPEHLMMVRGISDKKFRELQPLIDVGTSAAQR